MIEEFKGDYAYLSNFWPWYSRKHVGDPIVIVYEGIPYPSVEHAFQANKTLDKSLRIEISKAVNPGAAKMMGRNLRLRPGWDDFRITLMESLLNIKFFGEEKWSEELLEKLLSTYPQKLQEGNHWGDTFWGRVPGANGTWVGENNLGKLLMKLRNEIWSVFHEPEPAPWFDNEGYHGFEK
jgi:ribA/ribD-fused uncharacterized protein